MKQLPFCHTRLQGNSVNPSFNLTHIMIAFRQSNPAKAATYAKACHKAIQGLPVQARPDRLAGSTTMQVQQQHKMNDQHPNKAGNKNCFSTCAIN